MKEYQASPVSSVNHRDWSHDGKALIPANHGGSLGLGITSCRPVALLTIALQIKASKYFIEELMFLHHWRSGLWKEAEYALLHFCPSLMSYLRTDSDSVEMIMGGITAVLEL